MIDVVVDEFNYRTKLGTVIYRSFKDGSSTSFRDQNVPSVLLGLSRLNSRHGLRIGRSIWGGPPHGRRHTVTTLPPQTSRPSKRGPGHPLDFGLHR